MLLDLEEHFFPVVGFCDDRTGTLVWYENTRDGYVPLVGTPRGWYPIPKRGARHRA